MKLKHKKKNLCQKKKNETEIEIALGGDRYVLGDISLQFFSQIFLTTEIF